MAGLVPAVHVFLSLHEASKTWMPATSAGMTELFECPALAQRRHIPPLPALARRGAECRKAPLADRGAHAGHQVLVVGKIDLRQQHRAEHLVGADEMMQI